MTVNTIFSVNVPHSETFAGFYPENNVHSDINDRPFCLPSWQVCAESMQRCGIHSLQASAHCLSIARVLIDCRQHISTRFLPTEHAIFPIHRNLRSHQEFPRTCRFQRTARVARRAALMSGHCLQPMENESLDSRSRGRIGGRDGGTFTRNHWSEACPSKVQPIPGAGLFFPLKDAILRISPRLQIGHKVQNFLRRIRNQQVHRHGRNH